MPSDRERRIARRRAEIVEADMRTLLDGDNINWARKELDRDIRVTRRSLITTVVDTIRGSHTERRTTKISWNFPSTQVDTIRATSGVDSVRTRSTWGPVEITHVKPVGK